MNDSNFHRDVGAIRLAIGVIIMIAYHYDGTSGIVRPRAQPSYLAAVRRFRSLYLLRWTRFGQML